MSRKITQETFDVAVKENMELLDLSLEESIKETVSQFQSQGVNMFGIVTDPLMHKTGTDPVLDIKNKFLETLDPPKRIQLLNELSDLLTRDDAYKVSCANYGVYELLMDMLCSNVADQFLLHAMLNFLQQLLSGYPDILDERGALYFLSLLESDSCEVDTALKLIKLTCIRHETNRERYICHSISPKIAKIATKTHDDDILRLICQVVRVLTRNDDIRSEIPKSYSHALVLSEDILMPLVYHLKVKHEPSTLCELLRSLTSIIVNFNFCADVEKAGGVAATMKVLENSFNLEDKVYRQKLATECFKLFISLTGNDDVKHKLMEFDLAQMIHRSLIAYEKIQEHVHSTLLLISKISLRSPQYGQLFFKMDYPELVIQAFKNFPDDYSLLSLGCWCIRNMSARNPEFHIQYLNLGAEDILMRLANLDNNCSYDAKIALRELGCEVSAREPWTGEKGDKIASN